MKKLMTIGLAAAMTLAVASQVKAAVPLETSGELRVRMFYLNDYTGAVAKKGASNEFWDQRLRLTMNWPVAENVKMIARADILEGFWGDNGVTNTITVTEDVNGGHTVNTTPSGTDAKVAIDFDRVYMEFKWPGAPLTFSIGRQESSWGPGIAFKSDNRDRFKITGAFDFGSIIGIYQKRKEVFASHDTPGMDDNRQYGLAYVGKAADWNFGVVALDTLFDADPAFDIQAYLFDAYATGKAGPASISIEVAYTTGEKDFRNAGTADQDLSGMGVYAGAFLPAGPVTLGIEGAYCSGDKPGSAAKNEGYLSFDYHNPFYSVVLFNNMDLPGYAGESNVKDNTSLNNAYAGKLSVKATPAAGLTVVGAAVYAARLEDVKNAKTGAITKADPLGVEFDLVCIYAITPNVNWVVGAGYLLTGDFYGDADNALAATSQFVLNF